MICTGKRLVLAAWPGCPCASFCIKLPQFVIQNASVDSTVDPNDWIWRVPHGNMLTSWRRTSCSDVCPCVAWIFPQVSQVVDTIIATMYPEGVAVWIPSSHMVSSWRWLVQLLALIPGASCEIIAPQIYYKSWTAASMYPIVLGTAIKYCHMYRTSCWSGYAILLKFTPLSNSRHQD